MQCFGRIMGRNGDWFAEIDYAKGEAVVMERATGASVGPVAKVPLGAFHPADEDWDEELVADDAQNRRLMLIVFAPELKQALECIRKECDESGRDVIASDKDAVIEMYHNLMESLCRTCDNALSLLDVPEPENPKTIGGAK